MTINYVEKEVHITALTPAGDWYAVYADEESETAPVLYERLVCFAAVVLAYEEQQDDQAVAGGESLVVILPYLAAEGLIERADLATNFLEVVHKDDRESRHEEFVADARRKLERSRSQIGK